MTNDDRTRLICILAMLVIIVGIMWFFRFTPKDNSTLDAVKNAAYTVNDGHSLEAVDYAIITDMDSGMQYIYFDGYGVSPLITEDGEFSKTVE